MKRRTILASVFCISFAILSCSLIAYANPNVTIFEANETNSYSLTFNKEKNKLTTENVYSNVNSVLAELDSKNNKINFKASGVKNMENGWQSFQDQSYFQNIDHILGMDSITFNATTASKEATVEVFCSGDVINTKRLGACDLHKITFNNTTTTEQKIDLPEKPNYLYVRFKGAPIDVKSVKIIINNECRNFYSTVKFADFDENMGTAYGEGTYLIGSEVTVNFVPNNGYDFNGWYSGDTYKSSMKTYTFTLPKEGVVLTPTCFEKMPLQGNGTYKFGKYPQSKVINESLIQNLNVTVGGTSSKDVVLWNKYSDQAPNRDPAVPQYYKDIQFDGKKYRAVCVNEPYNSLGESQTCEIQYFKFEPIEWKVLFNNGFICSEYILDAGINYNFEASEIKNNTDNNVTYYPNNYELSDIRRWLGSSFVNLAFNDLEQQKIAETEIEHHCQHANYSSGPTKDKVFLLSEDDVLKQYYGFGPETMSPTRIATSTDYAECMGCFNDNWWLRTPSKDQINETKYDALIIDGNGEFKGRPVDSYGYGIRPALTLVV